MHTHLIRRLVVSALAIFIASTGGAAAAGLGQPCGGRLEIGCVSGLFCELPTGTCGDNLAEGRCVRIPRFCAQRVTLRPVCGCDGATYFNNCLRRRAIVAKRHDGRC
jgi:hypothetical protein